MIDPTWKRIGGFHLEEDGTLGVVWTAHDEMRGILHVYDCAVFSREVPAVITEGIGARGRHYPMAWRKADQAMADRLLDAGINVLPDPCTDNPAMIEVVAREVWQKMRTSQFRVDKSAAEWLREYREYYRDNFKVPSSGYPLMAATRHCVEMLPYAEPEKTGRGSQINYPKVAIV